MNPVLIVGRTMFIRMLRDLPSLIMLLLVPLVLIAILGSVFSWVPADIPYMRGVASPMAFFAAGFLVMFQLFGGGYSLTYVKGALFSPMRWRLYGLPCSPGAIVLGTVGAATLVSLCQGLLVVLVTGLAFGVDWGSLPLVVLVLLAVTLLSQLFYLTMLLALRNQGTAMTLGWFFAYGSCVAGGLIFPLPVERPFFRFLATYGNPYSLAQTALREGSPQNNPAVATLCLAVLYAAAALFALLAARLAKRKLA